MHVSIQRKKWFALHRNEAETNISSQHPPQTTNLVATLSRQLLGNGFLPFFVRLMAGILRDSFGPTTKANILGF